MNQHFATPAESELHDEATLSSIRAQYYMVRSEFLDRLACAQVVDELRFAALLDSMAYLTKSAEACGSKLISSDCDQLDDISSYLEQEAKHAKSQRELILRTQAAWGRASACLRAHSSLAAGG